MYENPLKIRGEYQFFQAFAILKTIPMAVTTTGIAFLISSIGLAFCGLRFFEVFQKMGGLRSGSQTGILLSMLFIGFSFQHSILAIGGIFFAQIREALYATLTLDHFVLAFVTALSIYLSIYILAPKISPWPVTIAVLVLGIFMTLATIIVHPLPFVTATNSIDWNMPYWLKLSWYLLLLAGIGAPFLVFAKNFSVAKARNVKNISLVMMAVHFAGIVNVSIIFGGFLAGIGEIRFKVFDIILAIIGIVFIFAFLLAPIVAGWIFRKPQDIENVEIRQ